MAEDDIYHNKRHYERFLANLESLTTPVQENATGGGRKRYYCKNAENVKYFRRIHLILESRDNSYVRRMRLFRNLLMVTFMTERDLISCDRDDINAIVAFSHSVNKTPASKEDFIKDIKFLWKLLFPEKDERGRIDEQLSPYPVRHLSRKIDKSKKLLKNDRLDYKEFELLVNYFSDNPQMQAYITLSIESLGRPQEICYTKINDLEMHESYAKVYVSSHGKEGTKFLQSIDSFPYLLKWYENHPYKDHKDSFLFICKNRKDRQLTPSNINKKLKKACKFLGIDKKITAYSLKRNGVTFSRLRGDSDVEIQHRAGWTSTKQLKTYDLSTPEDTFTKQLVKKGLVKEGRYKDLVPKTKECICGKIIGFAEKICPNCKRSTNKNQIKEDVKAEQEIRKVFTYALKNPDMSFVEIMNNFRKKN